MVQSVLHHFNNTSSLKEKLSEIFNNFYDVRALNPIPIFLVAREPISSLKL